MSEDPQPIYGTMDGWATTADPLRPYDNPNRAWYNALWQPKVIWMQRMTKLVGDVRFWKWTSVTGLRRVEWSEEDDGAEG